MIDPDVLFAVLLMACFLWTTVFLLFTGHYFISTVIDSASGMREVSFPADSIIDRLWRPALCLWILFFWVILGTILLAPLLAAFPEGYLVLGPILIWILFPVSLLSVLYTQNWVFMVHPKLVWQKLQHYGALAYVHFVTLGLAAVGVGLVALVLGHSFFWALPAAFILPTLILLYARHWGRFAWLILYTGPRRKRPKPGEPMDEQTLRSLLAQEAVPEMDVEEFNPDVSGIREGLPPTFPHAISAGVIGATEGLAIGVPAAVEATAPVEEEDEWAKNKKPYPMIEPTSPGMQETISISTYDSKPVKLSEYYDEQHRQKLERKRELESANRFKPPEDGEAPTFETALLQGVWEFLLYPTTLQAWGILIGLTIVELFFIAAVVRNWPDNNGG